ncbi:hypothetical protein JKP88DRAFT_246794 [Tribonema minus]|uniref:Uncharacterized protein n=1 Tax=Tribonema minus TaxID=303371 RepID=A0A835Z1D9_9STRA|nr:hypothetical protein JKP88DRAFT_246794 [Tribonema minus]
MPEAASKRQKLSSDAAGPEQEARSNSALQVCSNAPINLLIDGNMRGPRVRSGNPYLHRRPAGPASAASGANTRGRAPANPYAKPPPSKAAAEHSRRRLLSKKQLDSSLPVMQFQKQILVLSNMSDAEEAAAGLLAAQHAVVDFDLEWTAIRGAGRSAHLRQHAQARRLRLDKSWRCALAVKQLLHLREAGVGVDGDMLRLQRDYAVLRNGSGPAGALELSRMAAQR